jgi:hypothetical protein
MKIEGEPTKRYKLSYHGKFLGSYETAKEALKEWESYDKLVRPVVDRKKHGRYSIRDGNKEITIADLRRAAAADG